MSAEEREDVARLVPLCLLKQNRKLRVLAAHLGDLGERRLPVLLPHAHVDEQRDALGLQRREDVAADVLVEAIAVAAGEHLGRPHAVLPHLGDDLGAGRHLARVVWEKHPAREQARVSGRLLQQHAVAIVGVVLPR